MVLDTSLLKIQYNKIGIKGKWNNSGKGSALSPTPGYSRYLKGSLRVTFDYGQPTYNNVVIPDLRFD